MYQRTHLTAEERTVLGRVRRATTGSDGPRGRLTRSCGPATPATPEGTKHCNGCGRDLEFDRFAPFPREPDGLCTRCVGLPPVEGHHTGDVSALGEEIRAALRASADPSRAPGQQAYMKSAMPFLGVSVPVVRRTVRTAANTAGPMEPEALRDAARTLWDEAEYREERYAATALLAVGAASADHTVVPLVEHMVRTGRWWDYTDDLAHRLAGLHDREPAATAALVRRWSTDEEMWLRRISILSQLGRRAAAGSPAPGGRDRPEPRRPGVLHPQGDRLGAPRVRAGASAVGL